MKKIMVMVFGVMLSQSLTALYFDVVNMSGATIVVKPTWTGSPQKLETISVSDYLKSFNTGLHRLRAMVWRSNGRCWLANFEQELGNTLDRFRGVKNPVLIKIYNNGVYTVDLKGGFGEGQPKQAQQGNC